eukprot:gene17525-biopygen12884
MGSDNPIDHLVDLNTQKDKGTHVFLGETAADASGTRPFLQMLSYGTRPGRVRDASAAVSPWKP